MAVVVVVLYVCNVPDAALHHLDGSPFHLESNLFQRQLGNASSSFGTCELV